MCDSHCGVDHHWLCIQDEYGTCGGLFFNFAVQNGTIEALGGKMLYLINGRAALIPWIIFLMGFVIGALGAGMPGATIVGIVIQNLIANAGQMPERAVGYSMGVFLSRLAMNILIVFVIFIATKSYKAKKMQVDRPKDFEPVQKKTFRLLITCSAVIVVCVDPGHAVSGVRDLPDPFGHWPAADRDDIRRNYCHADEGGARR